MSNPIDDIPIPTKNKGNKTFEQLLEEELAKEGTFQAETVSAKKEFLKKSTMKGEISSRSHKSDVSKVQSTGKKSYKFFLDNMEAKASENHRNDSNKKGTKLSEKKLEMKSRVFSYNEIEETPIVANRVEAEPVRESKSVSKRPFLTRGSGKAGGIGNSSLS